MKNIRGHTNNDNQQRGQQVTRREILAGGATLVAAGLFGTLSDIAWAQTTKQPGVTTKNGGTKPIYVPDAGSNDAVAHSIADNLFWNDILMEHAKFFVMLMPGPELTAQRARAEQFQTTFANQFAKAQSASLDRSNYAAFNQSTIELVKPFIDFKHEMKAAQESGKLNSLVWPLFFDHTAREADRFTRRLSRLSRGESALERSEVVDFWTMIMAEHADFIAHLLDPVETALVSKAMATSTAFRGLHSNKPSSKSPVEKAVDDIIDFKTAAEKGIQTGQIKSIIHPALADHVRREAVKFADELKRAA
ncbi:MAG: DUF2935 domain-containing protein [Pyrinomonadaceae bacterium]|nr:DUF2935 domain-containing protein [Pyrinomonadaceae bacterium]